MKQKNKKNRRKKNNPIIEMEAGSVSFFIYVKDKRVHILMRYKYKGQVNGN